MPLVQFFVGRRQQLRALRDELAQHGVDDAAGAPLVQYAAGIDGEMNLRLGCPTRVLDLVRGGDQQRCQLRRQFVERAADQRRERGLEPQVPAQRSQRDGAHRRAILAFVSGFECRIRRPAFVNDVVDGDRRRGQSFGAGRVTGRARWGWRISPDFLHVPNLRPATRTALAKSRAEIGRLPARCSSPMASTPSPQATRRPSSARPNKVPGSAWTPPGSATRARSTRRVSSPKFVSAIGQGLNARTWRSS